MRINPNLCRMQTASPTLQAEIPQSKHASSVFSQLINEVQRARQLGRHSSSSQSGCAIGFSEMSLFMAGSLLCIFFLVSPNYKIYQALSHHIYEYDTQLYIECKPCTNSVVFFIL
jgi:hypothetical protein